MPLCLGIFPYAFFFFQTYGVAEVDLAFMTTQIQMTWERFLFSCKSSIMLPGFLLATYPSIYYSLWPESEAAIARPE